MKVPQKGFPVFPVEPPRQEPAKEISLEGLLRLDLQAWLAAKEAIKRAKA